MNKIVAVFTKLPAKKLFLSCLSMACALFISAAAHAQVEGCNPAVLDAMNKTSQGRNVLDVAGTEEIKPQNDSAPAMICMAKAAGVSAERGGNIFSGSFIGNANFASVITDALSGFFTQFADAEGFLATGVVDYTVTAPVDDTDCPGVSNLWEFIKEKGVTQGVPYVTNDMMRANAVPAGAGTRFTTNWETAIADGIFDQLNDAIAALPVPAIPVFTNNMTFCEVLQAAGVAAPCP
jgi:hypothetical protein